MMAATPMIPDSHFIVYSATPDSGRAEPLREHLQAVAAAARRLSSPELADIGELVGAWHDLGKYSDEFQRYIRLASADSDVDESEPGAGMRRVDHSTLGAQTAAACAVDGGSAILGRLIAYCIAGHHAGLADWSDDSGSEAALRARLICVRPEFVSARRNAPQELMAACLPPLPAVLGPRPWWKEEGSRAAAA